MKQRVVIRRNFFGEEKCRRLISLYDLHQENGSQRSWNEVPVVHYWDLPLDDRPALGELATEAERLINTELCQPDEREILIESAFIAMLPEGGHHIPHADNERPSGQPGVWEPNHTPQRCATAMLYLNGDFDGGDLKILNADPLNMADEPPQTIKPETGMLVMFPAGKRFWHWTEPVGRGGQRYSCPIWFTQIPRFAMRPKERAHVV